MGEFQVKLQREHQNFNYWVKNGHQRVPCTLMPWRKQVAPTALHSSSNTSPSKPPSCCGLDRSTLPSAMPGISLNGSSSLATFLGHSSALALSAVALPYKVKLLHTPRAEPSRRKAEMLMLPLVGAAHVRQAVCFCWA